VEQGEDAAYQKHFFVHIGPSLSYSDPLLEVNFHNLMLKIKIDIIIRPGASKVCIHTGKSRLEWTVFPLMPLYVDDIKYSVTAKLQHKIALIKPINYRILL
jgi:hypothetical protein